MKIKIGLIGLGTVGTGVYKTLCNSDEVEIVKVAVRNKNKQRNIENFNEGILTDNPFDVVNDENIDIVVELIGGVEPAKDLILTALNNGKHVVTANKELIAKNGEEIFDCAKKNNRVVLYEGAVAGGIPVIMPIKTILSANSIKKIMAILNGTTNYILTKMDVEGAPYEDVLKEAQKLGYAEADPTSDVEGFDSAYKIAILSAISFKKRIDINKVYKEGISKIRPQDIKEANELGYKIKLVALAQLNDDGSADIRVHPMLIKKDSILAHINYVKNAVIIEGHPVGSIALSGAGAGEFPTASSVTGDILAIANEIGKTDYPLPMMRCTHSEDAVMYDINDTVNKYYIALSVKNKKGVIGRLGAICAENDISLSNIVQKGVEEDNTADIYVITEHAKERDIQRMAEALSNDETVNAITGFIRVAD